MVRKAPGRERPRAHPTRPGRVNAALDQGSNCERESDRETDIAEVKKRRVEGEARILEQRVKAVAVKRRRKQTRERVGREQREAQEANCDPRLNTQDTRAQSRWQIAPECSHRGAEGRQNQNPEQQRTLVIAPHAGNFIEHGFRRMRIARDIQDREVRIDIGVRQDRESARHRRKLYGRRRARQCHPGVVSARRADHRQRGLNHRHRERQD